MAGAESGFVGRVTEKYRPIVNEYLMLWRRMGYFPHIRHPRSFNEKISHRKFYKPVPDGALYADKFAVRGFVAGRGHGDTLTELYAHTRNPDEIDFEKLPSQFVVKATHGSGWNILVEDKNKIDRKAMIETCWKWLRSDHGVASNEFQYRGIPPAIVIEQLLVDRETRVPADYRFLVFHGKVHYVHIDCDRFTLHTRRFYDRNWNPKDFTLGYPLAPVQEPPKKYEEMLAVAESLGRDFDFVRVDLYAVNDEKIYFGELTLTPQGGRRAFGPNSEPDFLLGALW